MPILNNLRASALLRAPVFYSSGTRCAKLTDIVINRSKRAPLLRGIVIDCGFKNCVFVKHDFIQSMDHEQIIIDADQHNHFDEFVPRADEILLFANILNCKKSTFKSLSGKIIDARIITSENGERFVDGVYVSCYKPREKKISHYLKLPKLAQRRTENSFHGVISSCLWKRARKLCSFCRPTRKIGHLTWQTLFGSSIPYNV